MKVSLRMLWALVIVAAPLPAAAQQPFAGGSVVAAVEHLKPGEFLWAPELAPAGPVMLVVSTATQRAILYRNGVPIAVTTVSTGRKGYHTPVGTFSVLQKEIEHYSSIYDNAPMPYMQRLTWRGIALHGGDLPGYPASHGCIRLPKAFAELLYGATALGMTVIVTDEPALPRLSPASGAFDPPSPVSPAGAQWHSERAPAGPVSIIVSAADQQMLVLRDGIEIGRAAVMVAGPVSGTSAYAFQSMGGGAPGWTALPLAGEVDRAADVDFWARLDVDPQFRAAVLAILAPGATAVITADTLALDRFTPTAGVGALGHRDR